MEVENNKRMVYKEQLFHLLMLLLEHGKWEAKNEPDFETDYYSAVARKLKFKDKTDWQHYQSSVFLLGDTQSAILSVFEYQLGDLSNKNRDFGGMNLRLYGALNAVYLQMGAYKEIMKLLNFPGKEKINDAFKRLDIYKLRGMAGSHAANYEYDKETLINQPGISKTTSFSIMHYRFEETGSSIEVIDKNGILFKYNLLKILSEYEKMATELLIQLIHHSIRTFYSKREDKLDMKSRLDELVPKLSDYSKINKNEKYREQQALKIRELIKDVKLDDIDLEALFEKQIAKWKSDFNTITQ